MNVKNVNTNGRGMYSLEGENMKKIVLVVFCFILILFDGCGGTNKKESEVETDSKPIDYTAFMDDKLISYLDCFSMPRDEVEKIAISVENNDYYLGNVIFLDEECQAIAHYGSGENQWNNYNKLYWIDLEGINTNNVDKVRKQLENAMYTTADQYGNEDRHIFNIDIPDTEYWIHVEESSNNDGMLSLSIHYGHTDSESSDTVYDDSYTSSRSSMDNTHICEVDGCNKIGIESITGFSGELEWYCTEHYNEMMQIIDHMLNGN